MRPDKLRATLTGLDGPTMVCAQAQREHGRLRPAPADRRGRSRVPWLHVDGAFGLGRRMDRQRSLTDESSSPLMGSDAHKTLNVPYDCGSSSRQTSSPSLGDERHGRLPCAARRRLRPTTGSRVVAGRRLGVYAALGRLGGSASPGRYARWRRMAIGWLEPRASRSSTRSASPRSWCALVPGGQASAVAGRRPCGGGQRDGTLARDHDVADGLRVSISNASTTEEDIDSSGRRVLRCARAVEVAASR